MATAKKTIKKTPAVEPNKITITPVAIATVNFTIKQRGESPLVVHAWSAKALRTMRLTAAERKKVAKVARNPEEEADGATYYMDDGRIGISAMAVKSSLLKAAHKDFGIPRTTVMKAMFLKASDTSGNLPLEYVEMSIREDCVRVGNGSTDLRYRPEFQGWSVDVCFEIDTRVLTPDDLVNLANNAGFGVGVGEWRPEKGGEWGRFEVDTTAPVTIS